MKVLFKIIALLLLVCSVAMFFLPWMKVSFTVDEKSFTLKELIDKNKDFLDTTFKDFKKELRDDVKESEEHFAEDGIEFSTKRFMSAADAVLDCEITPIDLMLVADSANMYANASKQYYEKNDVTETDDYQTVVAAQKYSSAAYIGLWVLYGILALLFVLAVYAVLAGKKLGALPYFLVVLLPVALFVVLAVAGNKAILSADGVEDLLDQFSRFGLDIDPNIFHVAIPCILTAVFALGGFVFCILGGKSGKKEPKRVPAPASVPEEKWTCPNCGAVMTESTSFCLRCGAPHSESARCAGCGAPLLADDIFCPSCGLPVASAPAPKSTPAPAGPLCPNCGGRLEKEDVFCPTCGAPVKSAPAVNPAPAPVFTPAPAPTPDLAPAPAPAAPLCPNCGFGLEEGDVFCPNCGASVKSAPEAAPAPEPAPKLVSTFRSSGSATPAPAAAPTLPPEGFSLPDDSDL